MLLGTKIYIHKYTVHEKFVIVESWFCTTGTGSSERVRDESTRCNISLPTEAFVREGNLSFARGFAAKQYLVT
jgi:hypothetical protein